MAMARSEKPRRASAVALLISAALASVLGACAAGGGARGPGAADIRANGPTEGAEYRRYADYMIRSGRFREERAPEDAPYGTGELLRNFELVAFEPEPALARYYPGPPESRRASKWVRPVTYSFIGDGVRRADRENFGDIAERLSELTGLPFRETSDPDAANMQVFVLTADARAALFERSAASPSFRGSVAESWISSLNPPCFALFQTESSDGGEISSAAIFIKDELDEPLRTACFLEETTQSLGLMFDHDEIRPSIFNDDQEFIALTRHDEALIMILYDPRIAAGMPRVEAVRTAQEIIRERAETFGAE